MTQKILLLKKSLATQLLTEKKHSLDLSFKFVFSYSSIICVLESMTVMFIKFQTATLFDNFEGRGSKLNVTI